MRVAVTAPRGSGTLWLESMVHRDALTAAHARIEALERELADAHARASESVPAAVARLIEEKRHLAIERDRLVIERDRLMGELELARAALARAEEESARTREDARRALAIRDQLRRQALDEATRAAARAKSDPPKPR